MKDQLIVGTANDRPHYMQQVMESWSKVVGIGHQEMVWYVEPGCLDTEAVIRGFDFCPTTIIRNTEHMGPLRNPWRALEYGFTQALFVLLVEDDSIVSPDILQAIFWARDASVELRKRTDLLAICAFTDEHGDDPALWRVTQRFHPTIWGTWLWTWCETLRDTWDHDYSHKGWDWNITENLLPGRSILSPAMSRSQHIGREGGSHCTPEMFEQLQAPSFLETNYEGTYRL